MAKTSSSAGAITYETLAAEIAQKHFRPVYYLMGAESYFIDRLTQLVIDHSLTPEERDFGLITLYGADTDIGTVINAARSFPMGAERMVVVVKEAQNISDMEQLTHYLQNVQPNNILVLCHKNGTADRRKKFVAQIEKVGALFESKPLYERQIPAFVENYLRSQSCTIDRPAAELLSSFVGTDLHRIAGELDKLLIAVGSGKRHITTDLVSQNIGVSKNYNNFELQNALIARDVVKANRIINYFELNPKENPIQATLALLFKHFSTLMLAHYSPDKSPLGLSRYLGSSEWQVKQNVIPALTAYPARKVMSIIGEIRRSDARSKGVQNPSTPDAEILKELIFFILH